jgi:hypothetical protein
MMAHAGNVARKARRVPKEIGAISGLPVAMESTVNQVSKEIGATSGLPVAMESTVRRVPKEIGATSGLPVHRVPPAEMGRQALLAQ